MNNRILFMIIDDQVKYLTDSNMDHREWYVSLGLDPNNYENIVRGFVMDGKIIFFKGMNFPSIRTLAEDAFQDFAESDFLLDAFGGQFRQTVTM